MSPDKTPDQWDVEDLIETLKADWRSLQDAERKVHHGTFCPDHALIRSASKNGLAGQIWTLRHTTGSNGKDNGDGHTKEVSLDFKKGFRIRNYSARDVGAILWKVLVTMWFVLILWNTIDGKRLMKKFSADRVTADDPKVTVAK